MITEAAPRIIDSSAYIARLSELFHHEPIRIMTEKGPVYSLVIPIQVDAETHNTLGKWGIVLPDNVTEIQFVSFKPEEHLPPEQRLLNSPHKQDIAHLTLTGQRKMFTPGSALKYQLIAIFGNSSSAKAAFSGLIPTDHNRNVLKIYKGHGGGRPFTIGEKSRSNCIWTFNGQLYSSRALRELLGASSDAELMSKGAQQLQAPGNHIGVQTLLSLDDVPETRVAGVIVVSCDPERDVLETENFPVAYVHGISRGIGGTTDYPRVPVVWDHKKREALEYKDERLDVRE